MHRKLIPAYLLTFVNTLGFSLLIPVLPFIVQDYGAPDYVYGLLLSLYSFCQFIGAPYLGRLSDTLGRKSVLLVSHAGTLFCWVIFGLASLAPSTPVFGLALPLFIIALARILDGLTGGNNSVAQAYVSDITTKEEKSIIFGYIGGIVGIAIIVGPGIGGYMASGPWGWVGTIAFAGSVSAITMLTIFIWLKESLPKEQRKEHQKLNITSLFLLHKRIEKLKPNAIIRNIFLVRGLYSIMMAAYISTIVLFVIDLFHFNEKQMGIFMLVVGIFISFNQAFIAKRIIQKIGTYATMKLGFILSIIGLISITLTDKLWLYIILYYVLNLGISLCIPCFNTLLAQNADAKDMGEVMGISDSILALTSAIIPVLAAALYGVIGYQIYYLAALLPTLCLYVAWNFSKQQQMSSNAPEKTAKPIQ